MNRAARAAHSPSHAGHGVLRALLLFVLAGSMVALTAPAGAAPAAGPPSEPPTGQPWTTVPGTPPVQSGTKRAVVVPTRQRTFRLDRPGLERALAHAPLEKATAKRTGAATRTTGAAPVVLALPRPDGGFERFAVVESPIMEAGLAAAHPDISTFAGRGVDDPTHTVRADLTSLGFHASVRGPGGAWYVEPYYHLDQSLYTSYFAADVEQSPHGVFVERDGGGTAAVEAQVGDLLSGAEAVAAGPEVQLRTYRLALVSDPNYATFFGGASNVLAAKVTLMNRVNQVYEDESAIRMLLIDGTDKIALNTAADMTGANGPCGTAPCFTTAQASTCSGGTLSANRVAVGQLIGAANYDIGHIVLGLNGGGVASLGVVGGTAKAQGCTGLPKPVGDFFAVDYVAHEMGHQFAGNHTFNGTQVNCSGGNRSGATSVEPGSGSSIMAYAGICGRDDLQPHSDPYWSQRSRQEVEAYVTSDRPAINEVQRLSLRDFDTAGDSFRLRYADEWTAPIVRGTNFTTAAIVAALQGLPDWPAGGTASLSLLSDAGFTVIFGGTLAATDVPMLQLDATGATGFFGDTAKGGPIDNKGTSVTATGNHAPVVDPPSSYTIPYRTPFALTGSATDVDGDALTYLWEQNNIGASGAALTTQARADGPLFRQFGTALDMSQYDPAAYDNPGTNAVTTDPTRVFPDLEQVLAGNTNARTGSCPDAVPASGALPARLVDCLSELLPTAAYAGPMSFRLTARDGNPGAGGVGSADTVVALAPGTGPFLVTSQGTATDLLGGTTQTVTWDVAGTDAAPVGTTAVRISLSADGGRTWPTVLAASTPNDGSADVKIPNTAVAEGRIKVEAIDNVFFAVNDASFSVTPDDTPPTANPTQSPAPNAAGWNNSPVTITWNWSDAGSGVDPTQCAPESTYSGPDGDGVVVTTTCTDAGGKTASATYTLRYDATAPALSPSITPSTVILGGAATADPGATDATSGVASASCEAVPTDAVSSGSVSCTATDVAGNTATGTASFTAAAFLGRIASPLPKATLARSTSTLPVKFTLRTAAGPLTGAAAQALVDNSQLRVTLSGPGQSATTPVGEPVVASTSACTWSTTLAQFQCNLKTPKGLQPGNATTGQNTYWITIQQRPAGAPASAFFTTPGGTATSPNPQPVYFK